MDNDNKWRLAYLKLNVKLEEERLITRTLIRQLAEKDLKIKAEDVQKQNQLLMDAKKSLTELEKELGYGNEKVDEGTVLQVGSASRKN